MAEGWSSLFWTAFKRSQNPMGLLDERRRYVEVNGALLKLLGRTRDEVVDHHTWEFVESGPKYNQREWLAAVHKSDFTGDGIVVTGDGSRMAVQYAAHVETVTGRRLILLVVLSYARGRHVRRERGKPNGGGLSRREREIVHQVALGRSGPEIAEELHIAHDTVRTHVRNAQAKLGARSRAQLVAMALAEGHSQVQAA
jgi:PAS domain S-box-containing protein